MSLCHSVNMSQCLHVTMAQFWVTMSQFYNTIFKVSPLSALVEYNYSYIRHKISMLRKKCVSKLHIFKANLLWGDTSRCSQDIDLFLLAGMSDMIWTEYWTAIRQYPRFISCTRSITRPGGFCKLQSIPLHWANNFKAFAAVLNLWKS